MSQPPLHSSFLVVISCPPKLKFNSVDHYLESVENIQQVMTNQLMAVSVEDFQQFPIQLYYSLQFSKQ